jgi:UPF0042 nucleotide-binding protein
VEQLKEKDGSDPEVNDWVLRWPAAREFLEDYSRLILRLLPAYIEEGKRYLTIAIGCTGGKHRSVVLAARLAGILEENSYFVNVFHRDVHLE